MRIPQIPSSWEYGLARVYSFDQYMKRVPENRSQWKITPVEPRPFPDEMRDDLALLQEQPFPVPLPVGVTGMGLMLALVHVWESQEVPQQSSP